MTGKPSYRAISRNAVFTSYLLCWTGSTSLRMWSFCGLRERRDCELRDHLIDRNADVGCEQRHQFGLLTILGENEAPFAATSEPAGFKVGRPAARQDQHACIGPFH